MFKISAENPNRIYLCIFGRRFVFDTECKKQYCGWYKA